MKSLLEKAIVALLNDDQDKAEALFHKFMVEKARHIHESLRQDEDINLDENWDDETKSEEYFDGDDMGSEEPHDDMDITADGDMGGDVDVDADGDMGDGMDDVDVDVDGDDMGEEGEPDIADLKAKAEDIEAQIHELTAEFDRMMGDEGLGDDDDMDMDMDGDEFETSDEGEDDLNDHEDEEPDLADRMDTDMSSDNGEEDPEHDPTMESVEEGEDDNLDEMMEDITESVLAELDRISSPSNTDGQEIGSGGKKVAGQHSSMLPNHGVNDRIAGAKPYMVKGGNNDSFARETAPTVKGVDTLVKGAKNSMASYDSKFEKKSKEGDPSALINKDFAPGEQKGKSIIGDGQPTKPKTR